MKKITDFIDRLVVKYKYKALVPENSKKARDWYKKHLPKLSPAKAIFDSKGKKVATGFERIVIGDYGAFVEMSLKQMVTENLTVPRGQEFRLHNDFYGKYIWLTTDYKNKIYEQIWGVEYADYKRGMYYMSPYEVVQ
jgi:hypothetical protein|tara:strand:- start:287 stop:697 length:411 start_codon:yes stop_codon:yes gene_type:complete